MSGTIVLSGASERARQSALALTSPTELRIFRGIVPSTPRSNPSLVLGFVGAHLGASPEELIREAKEYFDTNNEFESSTVTFNPYGEKEVRYRKAERLIQLAILREEILSGRGSVRSGILHNLLARHYTNGNEDKALNHYRSAIDIFIKNEGPSGRYLACALRDLGRHANKFANLHAGIYTSRTYQYTFEELPRYLDALEILEFTARVHEKLDIEPILGPKTAERARCLHRLGDCYQGIAAALRMARNLQDEADRLREISIYHHETAYRLYEKTIPLGCPIRRDLLTSLIVAHMPHYHRAPGEPIGEKESYWRAKAALEDAARNEKQHTQAYMCDEITFPWLPEIQAAAGRASRTHSGTISC